MQFKAGYIIDSMAKIIDDFRIDLNKGNPEERNKLNQIHARSRRHIERYYVLRAGFLFVLLIVNGSVSRLEAGRSWVPGLRDCVKQSGRESRHPDRTKGLPEKVGLFILNPAKGKEITGCLHG